MSLREELARASREVGAEMKRMAVLGNYELASALFNEQAYRGDLGLLTSQAEPAHGLPLAAANEQQRPQSRGR